MPQNAKVLIRPIDEAIIPPAKDPEIFPMSSREAVDKEGMQSVSAALFIHLPIHEASSNVADISSVPLSTEYISVDNKPVKVPFTIEDSDATIAQKTLFNRCHD